MSRPSKVWLNSLDQGVRFEVGQPGVLDPVEARHPVASRDLHGPIRERSQHQPPEFRVE
jgi:hypothetical protein